MNKRGRPRHPDILTPREWEVLSLLRQRLTNDQIAQRLDVSPATAKYHVAEILSKLGVATREEAAVWAPAAARPWWQRAFAQLTLATLAKGAGIALALAGVVALWLVLWGPWGDGEGEVTSVGVTPITSPTLAPASTVAAPQLAGSAELARIGEDGVYVVNAVGIRRLPGSEPCVSGRYASLSWSPTGHRLLCLASDGAGTAGLLLLMDGNGQVLAQIDEVVGSPIEWSATGAFFFYRTGGEIVLINNSGIVLTRLGPLGDNESGDVAGLASVPGRSRFWSRTGDQFVYWNAGAQELRIYSADTGTERAIPGNYRPILWLDDDRMYVAANYHREDSGFAAWDTRELQIRTGVVRPIPQMEMTLTDGRLPLNSQYWLSRDGRRVAVLTRTEGFPGLAVYDVDGAITSISGSTISFGSDHIPVANAAFSADGAELYWIDIGSGRGATYYYKANSDGTGLKELGQYGIGIGGLGFSPDGTAIAYIDYDDSTNPVLFVANLDGSNAREIDRWPTRVAGIPGYSFAWRPSP